MSGLLAKNGAPSAGWANRQSSSAGVEHSPRTWGAVYSTDYSSCNQVRAAKRGQRGAVPRLHVMLFASMLLTASPPRRFKVKVPWLSRSAFTRWVIALYARLLRDAVPNLKADDIALRSVIH